jgi:hypothetical protein
MRRGELLDFFHGQMREAVLERYLREEQKRLDSHRVLAHFFRSQADPESDATWKGDSLRGLSELPFHLTEAEEWQELKETLTDFHFLERKAAEVGVVETIDAKGNHIKLNTGVLLVQDDFDKALERLRARAIGEERSPIIITPVDFGEGYVVRCPSCVTSFPYEEDWIGKEIKCPQKGCERLLRVNPFVVQRSRR